MNKNNKNLNFKYNINVKALTSGEHKKAVHQIF